MALCKGNLNRLRNLGYGSYGEYLQSAHWEDVRRRYRASSLPQRCLGCGEARYTLHHRSYTRLGAERLGDLIPLCWPCHTKVHDYLRENAIPVQATNKALRMLLGWSRQRTRKAFQPFD